MFNKQLEYAPHVVGEQEEEHIGAEGVGWSFGKKIGGGLTRAERWRWREGGGESAHVFISQTQTHRFTRSPGPQVVMQGEHIIACGKISDGDGNERRR